MRHVFVFDPKAFFNQQWKIDNIVDIIGQFFRTQEKAAFSIQYSKYRRNALGIICDEIEKSESGEVIRIYAIGGEEILYDCVNGSAHFPGTQLAFVPYGETGNFLKIFNEDKIEVFQDIPSLIKAETLPTDIIKCGYNYALNSCFIGMNTSALKSLKDLKLRLNERSYRFMSGIFSFFNNIFSAFDRQSAGRNFKITVDGADYSGNYSLVHVANSPYIYGRKSGAAAVPDDGILNVVLIKASNPINTLFSVSRYFNGKLPKNCVLVQGKIINIHSDNPMWIQLDNEYIQDSDVNLSVVHHAAQITAAEGFSYSLIKGGLIHGR